MYMEYTQLRHAFVFANFIYIIIKGMVCILLYTYCPVLYRYSQVQHSCDIYYCYYIHNNNITI